MIRLGSRDLLRYTQYLCNPRLAKSIGLVLIAGTLLLAALTKLLRPGGAETLTLVSRCDTLFANCSKLLPLVEIAVAIAIVVRQTRQPGLLATIALLGAFSGAIVYELRSDMPLPCGCFGASGLSSTGTARLSLWASLSTNVVLLTLCTALRASGQSRRPRSDEDEDTKFEETAGAEGARSNGFSLVELMVVIVIVAVLLALLCGVIARVKARSQTTECASNLREISSAFAMYASENRGFVPRAGDYFIDDDPVWLAVIPRYLGLSSHFQWADLPKMRVLACPVHPTKGIPSAYNLNAFAFESGPNWRGSPPVQFGRIRRAGDVVWLVEASDRFGPAEFNPFDAIFFEPAHALVKPEHLLQRVSPGRHAGAVSNIAFSDGHVASEKGIPSLERFDDGLRAR